MKGAKVYYDDLIAHGLASSPDLKVTTVYQKLSSYINTESTGEVQNEGFEERTKELQGRHVLIVEDIFDTGSSMTTLIDVLKGMKVTSVRAAIAFHKENHENIKLNYMAEYVGFQVPQVFICGYGCDYNQLWRDVPHLFKPNVQAIKENAE